MTLTPFLPSVQGRTRFSLENPSLSVVMFDRDLTVDQQAALMRTVVNFYSESQGGPTRPMIDIELTRADTVCFRKVLGRELPTKELFNELLARLADELGYVDVAESDELDRLPPAPTHPKPLYFDHTKPGRGFLQRSKWGRARRHV